MQYALLDQNDPRIQQFTSQKTKTFGEIDHLVLDTMEMEENEMRLVKGKKGVKAFCPVCGERVKFRREHVRDDSLIHAAWVHWSGIEDGRCVQSEGLEHAMTKRFLFDRLAEKGYRVYEEKVHRFGERNVRADVAVMEKDGETLKLVVEVQASDTTVREVEKRTYAYFQEDAPVAWVLLIDTFFEQYKLDQDRERNIYDLDGTPELEPGKQYPFYLTGKSNAVFDLLMSKYPYIVAVRETGHILLIRRSPALSVRRIEAEKKGTPLSSVDDYYLATLIPEHQIADVLLKTPLIYMHYEQSESKKSKKLTAYDDGIFKGKECITDYRKPTLIDFEGGKTEFNPLDPLDLIQETMEALKWEEEERKRIRKQKALEEERRIREEKRRLDEIESQRKLEERRKLIAQKQAEREAKKKQEEAERLKKIQEEKERQERLKAEQERKRKKEEERKQYLAQQEEKWQKNHEKNELQRQQAERDRQKRLSAYLAKQKPVEPALTPYQAMQKRMEEAKKRSLQQQREQEERDLERMRKPQRISTEPYHDQTMLILWDVYSKLPPEKREQWERQTWHNKAIPLWFINKKKELLEKESNLQQEKFQDEA